MSDYLRRRPAGSHVPEPAVHKQKKARGLEKGEKHDENKCDHQRGPKNSRLSDVSSLSQFSYNYNSFDGDQHVSVVKRPADVECIYLDADIVSISSNESDYDIMEVGACISEDISKTQRNSKDTNLSKFLSSDLTEEGGIYSEPKLSLSPTVSSPTAKLNNSRIYVETTAKVDFVKNAEHLDCLELGLGEATLSSSDKTRKVLATQTFSTLSPSTVLCDPQSRHDPEENIGNELSNKKFCCTVSWSTYIYRTPLQCSCKFAASTSKSGRGYVAGSSSPVGQPALELESCQEGVNAKESMSTPKLQLPRKKRHKSNDISEEPVRNKKKTQTYCLGERCGVGRRRSQGENRHSKGKQELILNSVLELKTLRTRNKSGKVKITSVDSDIVFISSSESDSDIIEVEVSSLENVRKDLPRQNVSREVKLSSPMSTMKNRKFCSDAKISKADPKMNILNTEHFKLNSMATVEIPPDKTRKLLDVAQDHRTLTSLKDDGEKNSVQSEPNKFARNEGESSYVHPKQTDTLIGECVLRTKSRSVRVQDTGPESSKKNGQFMFDVRDNIHNDYLAATFMDEKCTKLEEQCMLHREKKCGLYHDNLLNGSGEAKCVQGNSISMARNRMFSEVLNEDSLTTSMEGIPEQSPASSDLNTEQHNQSLPLADQEYQLIWTDQLSEIMTHFPLGMQDMHTGRSSEDKKTAVINQKDCGKEVIDICLDNLEEMTKQFDEEYKSLFCIDRSKNVPHSEMPSDNLSDDKSAEKVQTNTCGKEFCCILNWSAYVCGEKSECSCTFLPNATNKPTMKNTRPGRPEPESTYETIETFASPKLDVNKSDIGNKRGKGKKVSSKYVDNSQLRLKKIEQSPLTQLCKNLFVKKKRKKTSTSTLKGDSGMDLRSKTESSGLYNDGSSSFKSDNIKSSLSNQDFKAPGQLSKERWPMRPENKCNLPNDRTRPKKHNRSSDLGRKSTDVCPAISNCSLELDISEQTLKALERFSPPASHKKGAMMNNSGVHIRVVKENHLMKDFQNKQMSSKKSVSTIDNRETFPDLETDTGSQLRKLEGERELSKYNYTLVNKVNKNTSSVVKRKSEEFHLLSAVQKLRDKGIDSKVKHHSAKKLKKQARNRRHCTLTEHIKTRSEPRRKTQSPGLDQNISCVETTEAPPLLRSSITWDKRKVRSKKVKNPRSKRGSPKRRKSGLSNRNTAEKQQTCTKECSLDLEQTDGSLGAAAKSFKDAIEAVVSKCTDQPPKENSQKLSYLENKPSFKYGSKKPSREKQQMKANVFRGKMTTCSYSNQNSHRLHVPSRDKIKATVSSSLLTNKVKVEQDTTSMDNVHLDKVSLPASDTEVKTADATCCGRPIEETTPKEKTCVRQCVVKLCKLPLALERRFL